MLKRILERRKVINPYELEFVDDLNMELGLMAVRYNKACAMSQLRPYSEVLLTPFKYKTLVGSKYGVIFETTRNHHGILNFEGKEKIKFGDGYKIVKDYFNVYGVVIVENPMGKYFVVNEKLKQEKGFIFDNYCIDEDGYLICSSGNEKCWAIPAYKEQEIKNEK